jgi:hypothetical protein
VKHTSTDPLLKEIESRRALLAQEIAGLLAKQYWRRRQIASAASPAGPARPPDLRLKHPTRKA